MGMSVGHWLLGSSTAAMYATHCKRGGARGWCGGGGGDPPALLSGGDEALFPVFPSPDQHTHTLTTHTHSPEALVHTPEI